MLLSISGTSVMLTETERDDEVMRFTFQGPVSWLVYTLVTVRCDYLLTSHGLEFIWELLAP